MNIFIRKESKFQEDFFNDFIKEKTQVTDHIVYSIDQHSHINMQQLCQNLIYRSSTALITCGSAA